jgi:hypothetical protein
LKLEARGAVNLKQQIMEAARSRSIGAAPVLEDDSGDNQWYLLEHGLAVANPSHCGACGWTIDSPQANGERYRIALDFLRDQPSPPLAGSIMRLLIGDKVVVVRSAVRLAQQFASQAIWLGSRVLVTTPVLIPHQRDLVLLCDSCGQKVSAKLDAAGANRYRWERLAQFSAEPVSPVRSRMRATALAIVRAGLDAASQCRIPAGTDCADRRHDREVARAYFFARDALLAGRRSMREIHLAAMRRRLALPLAESAMLGLGAKFARDESGMAIATPPDWLASGRYSRVAQPAAPEWDLAPEGSPAAEQSLLHARA